jgi:hypothetical protein
MSDEFEMLYRFTSTQPMADRLKTLIFRRPARTPDEKADKRRAIDMLTTLERCDWYPQAFEAALEAAEPGKFYVDDQGAFAFDPGSASVVVWAAAERVIDQYVAAVGPCVGVEMT